MKLVSRLKQRLLRLEIIQHQQQLADIGEKQHRLHKQADLLTSLDHILNNISLSSHQHGSRLPTGLQLTNHSMFKKQLTHSLFQCLEQYQYQSEAMRKTAVEAQRKQQRIKALKSLKP